MYVAHFMNAFAILSWEGIAAAPTTLRLSCSRALRQLATRTNAPWPHRIVCAGKHLIGLSGPFDLHDNEHATCNVRRATHNLCDVRRTICYKVHLTNRSMETKPQCNSQARLALPMAEA